MRLLVPHLQPLRPLCPQCHKHIHYLSTQLTLTDPLIIYQNLVESSILKPDEAQFRAAVELQKLSKRLQDYTPPETFSLRIQELSDLLAKEPGRLEMPWYSPTRRSLALIRTLSTEEELFTLDTPQGLLLSGEVGTGKTMLMNLFFESLPIERKRRWHHHALMLDLYARINRFRTLQEDVEGKNENHGYLDVGNEYVLLRIARELISEAVILAVDEFQLPDPAVAGIIKQVFLYYFKLGGILVATTNRLPEDLYARDFRRAHFKSFLDILQARCISFDMRSNHDYRKPLSPSEISESKYFLPSQSGWEDTCRSLTGTTPTSTILTVYSRPLHIPCISSPSQSMKAAFFDFSELCMRNLGPADYLTIASHFEIIIIDNVPVLTMKMKNEARRFITLLDALYECKVKLVIRAAGPPDALFFPDAENPSTFHSDKRTSETEGDDLLWTEAFTKAQLDLTTPYRPNVSSYVGDNEQEVTLQTVSVVDKPVDGSNLTAFTGEDERFAYKRAVSRLYEMPSNRWWDTVQHSPLAKLPWESNVPEHKEDVLDKKERGQIEREVGEFRHGASPFRVSEEKPPSFWEGHVWGIIRWGRKAGRWGLGTEAFVQQTADRKSDDRQKK